MSNSTRRSGRVTRKCHEKIADTEDVSSTRPGRTTTWILAALALLLLSSTVGCDMLGPSDEVKTLMSENQQKEMRIKQLEEKLASRVGEAESNSGTDGEASEELQECRQISVKLRSKIEKLQKHILENCQE